MSNKNHTKSHTKSHPKSHTEPFKIGTRGSDLALWQARRVASLLDAPTELKIIKTSGDRFQDIPLQGQSQIGFFTKEIEDRLLSKEIDLAVHSLKDLPTQPHASLELGAYLPRAAVPDLLLVHPGWYDEEAVIPVTEGCQVGATSLRRQALLRLYGPQAEPAMLRGNVPTRIRKCQEGQYGAIVLARAGVERLNLDLSPLLVFELTPEIWLPAPGQGAIAVQIRRGHQSLLEYVQQLNDQPTRDAVTLERQLLANFEGGCHTAFGAYAQPDKSKWTTLLGIDLPGLGWGQSALIRKTTDDIMQTTPTTVTDLHPITVTRQEELCKRIQL